ncbi:MAG: histidinol-phosphatase HisJ family protein [bacterium]
MIDLHVHTRASNDACGSIKEYWSHAKSLGTKTLCTTNHLEMAHGKQKRMDLNYQRDCRKFEQEFELAKTLADGPEVLMGIEVGNRFNFLFHTMEYIKNFQWDMLVGSAHVVDGFGIAGDHGIKYFHDKTEDIAYNRYFDAVEDLVEWGLFNTMGHFDIIKRKGVKFYGPFKAEKFKNRIKPILRKIKRKKIALELNTSGYFQEPNEPYPGEAILVMAYEMGINRITIGSDCHSPKHLGRGINRGLALLKKIGFKKVTIFRKQKPCFIKI